MGRSEMLRGEGAALMLEAHHVHPVHMGGAGPLTLRIRSAVPGDLAYIRGSFSEGVKLSTRRLDDMPWPDFKRLERPRLYAVLARDDTRILVADHDGAIAGWLALVHGRRVDTVHWAHTRWKIGQGELLRKRGVMRALVDAAQLKSRLVYTHRGAKRSDEWIVPWLARRGVTAAFVPWKDWIE